MPSQSTALEGIFKLIGGGVNALPLPENESERRRRLETERIANMRGGAQNRALQLEAQALERAEQIEPGVTTATTEPAFSPLDLIGPGLMGLGARAAGNVPRAAKYAAEPGLRGVRALANPASEPGIYALNALAGGGKAGAFKAEQMAARKAADVASTGVNEALTAEQTLNALAARPPAVRSPVTTAGAPEGYASLNLGSGGPPSMSALAAKAPARSAPTTMNDIYQRLDNLDFNTGEALSGIGAKTDDVMKTLRPQAQQVSNAAGQALRQAKPAAGQTAPKAASRAMPSKRNMVTTGLAGTAAVGGASSLDDIIANAINVTNAPVPQAAPATQPERFPGTELLDYGTIGTAEVDPNIVLQSMPMSSYEDAPAAQQPQQPQAVPAGLQPRDPTSRLAGTRELLARKDQAATAAGSQQAKPEGFGRKLLRSLATAGLAYSGKLDPQTVLDKDYINERRSAQRANEARQLTPSEEFEQALALAGYGRDESFNNQLELLRERQAGAVDLEQLRQQGRQQTQTDRLPPEVQLMFDAYMRGASLDENAQAILSAYGIPYDPEFTASRRRGSEVSPLEQALADAIRRGQLGGGAGARQPAARPTLPDPNL
jgi:hypothetical protein